MAETVKIFLDNYDSNICYPGQTLTGRVECVFEKKEQVQGIQLNFNGTAKTEFNLRSGTSEIPYFGKEVYFDQKNDLVSGGDTFYLYAGKHTYPFSYALPQLLPSKFDAEYGIVEYSIKVTVKRPSEIDYEDKLILNVVSPIDLNVFPALKKSRCVSVEAKVGYRFFGKDPFNLIVRLPHTGFVEGEKMNVSVSVINMSNVTVQYIKFKMKQDVKFFGLTRKEKSGVKELEKLITEWRNDGVGQAQREITVTANLTIPKIQLATLADCSIINITYRLEVKLVMPFPHSSIVANIPITIGTIPLLETNSTAIQRRSCSSNPTVPRVTLASAGIKPTSASGCNNNPPDNHIVDHPEKSSISAGINVGRAPQTSLNLPNHYDPRTTPLSARSSVYVPESSFETTAPVSGYSNQPPVYRPETSSSVGIKMGRPPRTYPYSTNCDAALTTPILSGSSIYVSENNTYRSEKTASVSGYNNYPPDYHLINSPETLSSVGQRMVRTSQTISYPLNCDATVGTALLSGSSTYSSGGKMCNSKTISPPNIEFNVGIVQSFDGPQVTPLPDDKYSAFASGQTACPPSDISA